RLEEVAGIAQAVVIPREDTPGDVRLVAYLRGEAIPAEADIRATLRTSLPAFMRPQHYATLTEFPLTPNKKVDRKALPAPEETRKVEVKKPVEVAPIATPTTASGDVAATVAAIWSRVLGVAEVSATDNFFDIGGYSLLAVQAHRDIRTETGAAKLSITDIFRFPTMGSLVTRIEELTGGRRPEDAPKAAAPEDVADRADSRSEMMSKRRAMRARRRART
ncbi:MAG: peptide synthetase, partial [Shimia sp.]|nr:peptide synthetase [Shimia sp.]